MAKTERITVWVVTLPNGKKVEVDPAVAARYFNGARSTTPFSHLHLEPIVKTVRVKPTPAPKPPPRKKAARPLKTAKKSARKRTHPASKAKRKPATAKRSAPKPKTKAKKAKK